MKLSIATDATVAFTHLGGGKRERGVAQVAHFVHRALLGTQYIDLVDYRDPAAIAESDLEHLSNLSTDVGLSMITALLDGEIAGMFWGYSLDRAPTNVRLPPEHLYLDRDVESAVSSYPDGTRDHEQDDLSHAGQEQADLQGVLGSRFEVHQMVERIRTRAHRVFYVDWLLVGRRFRRLGLARLLYSIGLQEAFADSGRFDAYVVRTTVGNKAFMRRFYCQEMGARVLYSVMEEGILRFIFGGTGDRVVERARSMVDHNSHVVRRLVHAPETTDGEETGPR